MLVAKTEVGVAWGVAWEGGFEAAIILVAKTEVGVAWEVGLRQPSYWWPRQRWVWHGVWPGRWV